MSIGTPADIFITKYTVKTQKVNNVKKEVKRRIFWAKSSEKNLQTKQKSIRPPSSVERGTRLNIVSKSEMLAKEIKKSVVNAKIGYCIAKKCANVNPRKPKSGPPKAKKNSSR